jgi:hypothetical protein
MRAAAPQTTWRHNAVTRIAHQPLTPNLHPFEQHASHMKNKTAATWLTLIGGPLGLHRFYLYGWRDLIGWLLPWPSLIGLFGVLRARELGVDDQLSWVLAPLLGFVLAGCALTAIVYGLRDQQKWNRQFNAAQDPDAPAGRSNGLTILAAVCAMLVGTTALVASLAYVFQHYFEYQAL